MYAFMAIVHQVSILTFMLLVRLEFEGYWHKGKKHFRGINRYKNGDCYSGEWSHGHKHGKGKQAIAALVRCSFCFPPKCHQVTCNTATPIATQETG